MHKETSANPIDGLPSKPAADDESILIWQLVRSNLLRYAIPDSRFHDDLSRFIPDFHSSKEATNRVTELACYKEAHLIFFTADNSLQELRFRALRDGKKIIVATHHLCRGFVLLDPQRIPEDQLVLASCLDGMERPGLGRHLSLERLQEAGLKADLVVTGSRVVTTKGRRLGCDEDVTKLAWLVLADRGVLDSSAPLVTLVHDCQVHQDDESTQNMEDELQCDYIMTPEQAILVEEASKPDPSLQWLDKVSDKLIHVMAPLQELKGIKAMERIMAGAYSGQTTRKPEPEMLSADAQMGIDIVNRLMRGYKP